MAIVFSTMAIFSIYTSGRNCLLHQRSKTAYQGFRCLIHQNFQVLKHCFYQPIYHQKLDEGPTKNNEIF